MRRCALTGLIAALVACGGRGPVPPAPIDTRSDACASCRMAVSDPSLAAQIVAPGEDPRFFDDIGCLAAYLKDHGPQPDGSVAYVADHRTREWIGADVAIYTRLPALQTPMGSHLVAHADQAGRSADAAVGGAPPAPRGEIFGSTALPGGSR